MAVIITYVSGNRTEIFKEVQDVMDGFVKKPNGEQKRPYELIFKPVYESKTDRQLKAIWGKINEISAAIGSSPDEVYELCIKRYGISIVARTDKAGLSDMKRTYRFVDVKEEREDETYFVRAWRGLSTYNTKEATTLLDGILSECKEIGISTEIKQ